MAKFKFKDAAMTALGATGGAYGADFIDDQITDKVEDPKMEIGAKLLAFGAAAYFAQTSKGVVQHAAIAALGQFGQGIIESAKDMMTDSKPTKGVDEELQGIYDEIDEALKMNGNTATVSGNDPAVSGSETGTVTGVSYNDRQDDQD